MLLLKLLFRLWLIGVHMGLWSGQTRLQHPASSHSAAVAGSVVGIAARQGRRFSMEDRAEWDSAVLPPGRGCGPVNYTYAAVYDGHEGSAVSELLAHKLSPAVHAAVTAAWRSTCSLQHPSLQTSLTSAAHQINTAFLDAARQQKNKHTVQQQLPPGSQVKSNTPPAPGSSSSSSAAEWDGDDGSTAVFAVLAGGQLLVGNVGNSRAVLCTSARSSSSSPLQHGSSSSDGSSSSSSSSVMRAAPAATSSAPQPTAGSSRALATRALPSCTAMSSTTTTTTSSSSSSGGGSSVRPLQPVLLTQDHTPVRADEAQRIRAAGGSIAPKRSGGKPRVKGELEVTRSFGDVGYVEQGVIATPEFSTTTLQPGDAFLILASDGVFEVLSPAEVCSHADAVWRQPPGSPGPTPPPPPALALPGAVAADSTAAVQPEAPAGATAGEASGALETAAGAEHSSVRATADGGGGGGFGFGSAGSTGASRWRDEGFTGCCDCSRQQQWLQSVPEAWTAFESRGAWRKRRRVQQRRQARLRSRLAARSRHAAAAAAAAAAAPYDAESEAAGVWDWLNASGRGCAATTAGASGAGVQEPDDDRVHLVQQSCQQQQQQLTCGTAAGDDDEDGCSCVSSTSIYQDGMPGHVHDWSATAASSKLPGFVPQTPQAAARLRPAEAVDASELELGGDAYSADYTQEPIIFSTTHEDCCQLGSSTPREECRWLDRPHDSSTAPAAGASAAVEDPGASCIASSPEEECYDEYEEGLYDSDENDGFDGVAESDLDALADISYSYCRSPQHTPAPYTLPQAVAVRLADEAYNRMSMDNIAVVVVDIREAAATSTPGAVPLMQHRNDAATGPVKAENGPQQQQQPQCAPKQQQSLKRDHDRLLTADVAADASRTATTTSSSSSSSIPSCSHRERSIQLGQVDKRAADENSPALRDADDEAGPADTPASAGEQQLHLPSCWLAPSSTGTAAAGSAGATHNGTAQSAHASAEGSGDDALNGGNVQQLQLKGSAAQHESFQGGVASATASGSSSVLGGFLQRSIKRLWPVRITTASSPSSTAAAGAAAGSMPAGPLDAPHAGQNEMSRLSQGYAVLCEQRADQTGTPSDIKPSQPARPSHVAGAEGTHSSALIADAAAASSSAAMGAGRGNLDSSSSDSSSSDSRRQHAGGAASPASAASHSLHNYVLVQKMHKALNRQPNHIHLHPVLGVDEVRLQQHHQGQEHWQGQGSVASWSTQSLFRHMEPSSMLLQLPATAASMMGRPAAYPDSSDTSSSGGSSSRELLCHALLDSGKHHELAVQHHQQQQQQLLQLPGYVGYQYPALPSAEEPQDTSRDAAGQRSSPKRAPGPILRSKTGATSSSRHSQTDQDAGVGGFLSACLAGAAADPGTALVQGSGGLSAVVAALAAVPLQQQQHLALGTGAEAVAGLKPSHGEAAPAAGSGADMPTSAGAAGATGAAAHKDHHLIEPAWGASVEPPEVRLGSSSLSGNEGLEHDYGALAIAPSNASASTDVAAAALTAFKAGLVFLARHGRSLLTARQLLPAARQQEEQQEQQEEQQEQHQPDTTAATSNNMHLSPESSNNRHATGARMPALPGDSAAAAATRQLQQAESISSPLTPKLQVSGPAQQHYTLGRQFGRGHFGEVWSAVRAAASTGAPPASGAQSKAGPDKVPEAPDKAQPEPEAELFVLKRVLGSRGGPVRRSALREAYFGQLMLRQEQRLAVKLRQLQEQRHGHDSSSSSSMGPLSARELFKCHSHLVRYIEAFKTRPGGDVWLVFKNEGQSLHNLMYEPVAPRAQDEDPSTSTSSTSSTSSSTTSSSPPQDSHDSTSSQANGPAGGAASSSTTAAAGGGLSVVGPSRWWLEARQSATVGHALVMSVMKQLLQSLAAVHAAGVSHRDVKPENLLVREALLGVPEGAGASASVCQSLGLARPCPLQLHLRLIDFGSAVDAHSIASGLYGPQGQAAPGTGQSSSSSSTWGPSLNELTLEYAPPEVVFSSRYRHPLSAGPSQLHAYDMWSAGVVMLELVLGTPAVFAPSPATRAAVDKQLQLRGRPAGERQLLYLLRGLMELCLYPPRVVRPQSAPAKPSPSSRDGGQNLSGSTNSTHHAHSGPTSGSDSNHQATSASSSALPLPWSCSEESLLRLVSGRDPTGLGLEGGLALRLLQRLLSWEPSQRPTAAQALQHAYFTTPRTETVKQQQQQHEEGSSRKQHRDGQYHGGPGHQLPGDVDSIKLVLHQQAHVLRVCSTVPIGEPGWC